MAFKNLLNINKVLKTVSEVLGYPDYVSDLGDASDDEIFSDIDFWKSMNKAIRNIDEEQKAMVEKSRIKSNTKFNLNKKGVK